MISKGYIAYFLFAPLIMLITYITSLLKVMDIYYTIWPINALILHLLFLIEKICVNNLIYFLLLVNNLSFENFLII